MLIQSKVRNHTIYTAQSKEPLCW